MDRRGLAAVAVDAILMEGRPVTVADIDRILKAEAERAAKAQPSLDPEHDALRHQARRLAELTADAVEQSHDFGSDLSANAFQLTGGAESVDQIVKAMVQRTRGVEAQLRDASREIDELRQQVEASRDDAKRDALTGLLNRRGAMQELAGRKREATGVIALCDVDRFKQINDRFGHGVGDRVLKGIAASLSGSLNPHVVARWGGEEFFIYLDGVSTAAATALLERAREGVEARTFRLRDDGKAIGTVTVSIGLADFAGISVADSIEAADRMLYVAKRDGRNRVVAHPASEPA
ncbi:MAG: GGDEF domain-containing protein [Janthinobacterium lividum]